MAYPFSIAVPVRFLRQFVLKTTGLAVVLSSQRMLKCQFVGFNSVFQVQTKRISFIFEF
jgi:hypothetical protein